MSYEEEDTIMRWKEENKAKKEPASIEAQILQEIYDELMQLHRQVGEITLLLHKKDIITVEQAQMIINMPRTEEKT